MNDYKQKMREFTFGMLGELTLQEVFIKSKSILKQIKKSNIILGNYIFMVFNSMKKEFDTAGLISFLLKNKKKVLVPKVINEKDMIAIDIQTGETFSGNIDVAYIPGVVFGYDYNRVGRGKGYYDRFIAENRVKLKIGVGFDIQLVNNIKVEFYDKKMDNIITESFYL